MEKRYDPEAQKKKDAERLAKMETSLKEAKSHFSQGDLGIGFACLCDIGLELVKLGKEA